VRYAHIQRGRHNVAVLDRERKPDDADQQQHQADRCRNCKALLPLERTHLLLLIDASGLAFNRMLACELPPHLTGARRALSSNQTKWPFRVLPSAREWRKYTMSALPVGSACATMSATNSDTYVARFQQGVWWLAGSQHQSGLGGPRRGGMTCTTSFGRWLKLRRLALDLTQLDLGQLVGCSAMTIRKIEADERRPSRQLAERLAQHLGIPSEDRTAFLKAARAELCPDRLASPVHSHDLSPARHRDHLPAALTHFIGREREVASLSSYLLRPNVRLLTLTGPGGSAKLAWGCRRQLRCARRARAL
jgi:transcriptional regulator with XRE-family HTH domain